MQLDTDAQKKFIKVWYLKLTDPTNERSLWLRFGLLSSGNGFRRVAEVWAVFFQRGANREVKKVAVKQTHDIRDFITGDAGSIKIGDCELSDTFTRGSILSKGHSIQWDLRLLAANKVKFDMVAPVLSKIHLVENSITTDCEDLLCTGSTQINGETVHWKESPGMQGRFEGPKSNHSWVWGHGNTFTDESGKPASLIFEGSSARTQIGPLVFPKLSSFFFHYRNENYFFNTLKDALFLKSQNNLNEWKFQADRQEISFRGSVTAEHKDFAGITYEDTNGSFQYSSCSQVSDMKILVYRRGKLEASFTARGSAGFEVVSREKNPYVSLLV